MDNDKLVIINKSDEKNFKKQFSNYKLATTEKGEFIELTIPTQGTDVDKLKENIINSVFDKSQKVLDKKLKNAHHNKHILIDSSTYIFMRDCWTDHELWSEVLHDSNFKEIGSFVEIIPKKGSTVERESVLHVIETIENDVSKRELDNTLDAEDMSLIMHDQFIKQNVSIQIKPRGKKRSIEYVCRKDKRAEIEARARELMKSGTKQDRRKGHSSSEQLHGQGLLQPKQHKPHGTSPSPIGTNPQFQIQGHRVEQGTSQRATPPKGGTPGQSYDGKPVDRQGIPTSGGQGHRGPHIHAPHCRHHHQYAGRGNEEVDCTIL